MSHGQHDVNFGDHMLGRNAHDYGFGLVVYDLETIHDAERGIYADKGMFECSASEAMTWKTRSQIIEFAAIDLVSGERIQTRCRPEFRWCDVRSEAAWQFA